ncbi:succinate dehydrogenase/fumarate reductase iron-sulfur subunit [Spirulina subsalsa]|uniref:succinate dehydrogenase/fumarate reductase iron-sulfur subunit n=1 Tax=Spirulina subsalsa TaxID=54311 RepID=UPI000303B511|nr:succinate dehydrogenase/fumarate reductase iron-sulfur subunit [Spirulina subsalsa]
MQVNFKILRQSQNGAPRVQNYTLLVTPATTILDCLNQIKWEQDGTLAFRKNCRNTICGSCGMRINGRSALACKENIAGELARLEKIHGQSGRGEGVENVPEMTIAPLGNLPIIKDLIVDMQPFWDNLEAVEPYISTAGRVIPEREFLQSPEERAKLDQMGNCIMCGSCYSECNARTVNPDFVGPHALAKAHRAIADSRDHQLESRLEQYNDPKTGVWGCTRCYLCNEVCPMEVAPMDQIGKIKGEILARHDAQASRPIRHRKVLIDLVKQGGWIDERQFALRVMSNSFRDVKGLLSLAPVGLQVLKVGKMPFTFEPSEGTAEVRSLIEAVQAHEADQKPS